MSTALHQRELCEKLLSYQDVCSAPPHYAVPLPNLFQDPPPPLECCQLQGQYCPLKSRPEVTMSKWVISVGHEKESEGEREKQWGRVCVQLLDGVLSTELI